MHVQYIYRPCQLQEKSRDIYKYLHMYLPQTAARRISSRAFRVRVDPIQHCRYKSHTEIAEFRGYAEVCRSDHEVWRAVCVINDKSMYGVAALVWCSCTVAASIRLVAHRVGGNRKRQYYRGM